MSQRIVRVNELVKREISDFLHTRYQSEAVCITITGVELSPDLRHAHIYYSVIGEYEKASAAGHFLKQKASKIRRSLGKRIVLKYLPFLNFVYDDSIARGVRLNSLIDDLNLEEKLL